MLREDARVSETDARGYYQRVMGAIHPHDEVDTIGHETTSLSAQQGALAGLFDRFRLDWDAPRGITTEDGAWAIDW